LGKFALPKSRFRGLFWFAALAAPLVLALHKGHERIGKRGNLVAALRLLVQNSPKISAILVRDGRELLYGKKNTQYLNPRPYPTIDTIFYPP
jgi:hypothetical protein